MTGTMFHLMAALAVFVGTHFLLSHPLRRPLVGAIGERAFLGLYSVVAIATLVWVYFAFRAAPVGQFLWSPGDELWALATALMFVASVLLVGSLIGNPALPDPTGRPVTTPPARGVFAITRHPMMWSFAIWAAVHFMISPRPAVFLVSVAVIVLAIGGAAGQDAKKKRLTGEAWRDWARRTAFVPFAGQITGRIPWAGSWPGRIALVGGTLVWLAATWAHPWLGAPVAGVWRWVG
ncbi:MAG: MFS transporter [Sphingomonadaceae bacterium]|nr:MFS transporter [Sphingomonadaceae bacterium]